MADQADTLRKLMEYRDDPSGKVRTADGQQLPQATNLADPVCPRLIVFHQVDGLILKSAADVLIKAGIRATYGQVRDPLHFAGFLGEANDCLLLDFNGDVQLINTVASLPVEICAHVITLDAQPQGLAKAFYLIKTLHLEAGVREFGIIVNSVTDQRVARRLFSKLADGVRRILKIKLEYLGFSTTVNWGTVSSCVHSSGGLENYSEAVLKRKFLLDLNCVDAMARKVSRNGFLRGHSKVFQKDLAEAEANGLQLWPGKVVEFFRCLLGEVKTWD